MHEVLVNRLGGLSLPRKSVVRLTDRPDMTLDVYRGRKKTKQQQQHKKIWHQAFTRCMPKQHAYMNSPGKVYMYAVCFFLPTERPILVSEQILQVLEV